jgi:hypothetical protein
VLITNYLKSPSNVCERLSRPEIGLLLAWNTKATNIIIFTTHPKPEIMEEKFSDNSPGNKPKEPIFLERGDGLGWTLNFNRPISYLILAVILAIPFCVTAYCIFFVKK